MAKIWIVDAFAKRPYTGNPAAVMLVEQFPTDAICQKIAAEMNLSETAFVKEIKEDHFHIRWFTPKVEVKLCGHATLASAHVLHEQNRVRGQQITFESLSGPLLVRSLKGSLTLDFPLQKTSPLDSLNIDMSLFEGIISWAKAYDDLIIELESERHVREFKPNFEEILKIDCRGLIITARACGEYDFVSRFFAPRVGVNEDPVTGSAHCKLAHYWQSKLNKTIFKAYQASSRGGEIGLEIVGERVCLQGGAITIVEGEWKVDLI